MMCEQLGIKYKPKDVKAASTRTMVLNHNPHYNTSLLYYLIKYVFPIAPLLDHSLMVSAGLPSTFITSGAGETNWSLLKYLNKEDIEEKKDYKLELPMKIGRYIFAYEDVLRGRLNRFESGLSVYTAKQQKVRCAFQKKKPTARKSTAGVSKAGNPTARKSTTGLCRPHDLQGRMARKSTAGVAKVWGQKRDTLNASGPNPETEKESWKKKGPASYGFNITPSLLCRLPRIPWGGHVTYDGITVKLYNTCSFDNILQTFYFLFKTNDKVRQFLNLMVSELHCEITKNFLAIFDAIDAEDFPEVRRLLLQAILHKPVSNLRLEMVDGNNKSRRNGDMYGSEFVALETLAHYVQMDRFTKCNNRACPVQSVQSINPMTTMPSKTLQAFFLAMSKSGTTVMCDACDVHCKITYSWGLKGPAPFVAIDLPTGSTKENMLKYKKVNILGVPYTIAAYTLYSAERGHFYSILKFSNKWYKYDGKFPETLDTYQPRNVDTVSTLWFTAV